VSESDLRNDALAVLDACRVVTLSTCGSEGPWAAPVFYAHDGFELVFVSSLESRHARHLAVDPRCAVAIFPEPEEWQTIRGVQMGGTVERLHGPARVAATARYVRRFPFTDPRSAPPAVLKALGEVAWYRFVPHEIYLVDNARGFGRLEVVLT